MKLDAVRVRAVIRKELAEFRRNRLIIGTMAVMPVLFIAIPLVNVFTLSATAPPTALRATVGSALLLQLLIPVILPAVVAAYSVIGEREQGTLEPLLTTPITSGELLLGKGLAAMLPAVGVTYVLLTIFFVSVRLGAGARVVHAVWQLPQALGEVLFAPLLAGWAIAACMTISARSSDIRVAQQLGTFASLPVLGLTVLISFRVIHPTVLLAVAIGAGILVVDAAGWWMAARTFDRERLVLGRRARRAVRARGRSPAGR